MALIPEPLTVDQLTDATTGGNGVFDVLMRANKAHLEQEFRAGRIKGPEYSTVYLGSLQAVMQTALAFLLAKDKSSLEAELLQKQIELTAQQVLNAEVENRVLEAQICKLQAEFDLIMEQKTKTAQELALLTQKVATERAQTQSIGVDADSVIGKQKALYGAQTDGFKRDAEQKAADLLIKSWMTRRTTDEGTVADVTNKLDDATIGRTVTKLLEGVGA